MALLEEAKRPLSEEDYIRIREQFRAGASTRLVIAAMLMQGCIADLARAEETAPYTSWRLVAQAAVALADMLIEESGKE